MRKRPVDVRVECDWTCCLPSAFHPLLDAVQALHRRIRHDVVETCERAAVDSLSVVARDDEGDTIYAIDRVAEHLLTQAVEQTMATRDEPVVLEPDG